MRLAEIYFVPAVSVCLLASREPSIKRHTSGVREPLLPFGPMLSFSQTSALRNTSWPWQRKAERLRAQLFYPPQAARLEPCRTETRGQSDQLSLRPEWEQGFPNIAILIWWLKWPTFCTDRLQKGDGEGSHLSWVRLLAPMSWQACWMPAIR